MTGKSFADPRCTCIGPPQGGKGATLNQLGLDCDELEKWRVENPLFPFTSSVAQSDEIRIAYKPSKTQANFDWPSFEQTSFPARRDTCLEFE